LQQDFLKIITQLDVVAANENQLIFCSFDTLITLPFAEKILRHLSKERRIFRKRRQQVYITILKFSKKVFYEQAPKGNLPAHRNDVDSPSGNIRIQSYIGTGEP
jgi:hypothetical protein